MIELLLQAERALSLGLVDQAERFYRQAVEADPRNSIAVVGLARVALERADDASAWRLAKQALEIDPENVAASRLAERIEEVYAHRGLGVPVTDAAVDTPAPMRAATHAALVAPVDPAGPAPEPGSSAGSAPSGTPHAEPSPPVPTPVEPASSVEATHPTLLDRLLRRNRR